MKSVLISIQPKWCELIASGKKTVEVRKTKPKLETPFKVYIYETQGRTETPFVDEEGHHIFKGRGQVIGEFVCDEITEYEGEFWDDETQESIKKVIHSTDWDGYPELDYSFFAENGEENHLCKSSCLTWEELRNYIGQGINTFYGWHISDLVIYDKPREVSEFVRPCNHVNDCWTCDRYDYIGNRCYDKITRPPQSWCYVEKGE